MSGSLSSFAGVWVVVVVAVAAGCGGSSSGDDADASPGTVDSGDLADASSETFDSGTAVTLPALHGYWPFNDNAEDASGNNVDLTLVGDATLGGSVSDGLGMALSLDGEGDGAIAADFVKVSGEDMTVVAWVHATSLTGDWNTIVKNWGQTVGGQFHLGLGANAANTVHSQISNGSVVTSADDFPTVAWVHVALVVDSASSEHRLYVNGELEDTVTYETPLAAGTATGLGVGVKPNDDGSAVTATAAVGYWHGSIDEVGIYAEALTQEQLGFIRTRALAGVQLDGTSAN